MQSTWTYRILTDALDALDTLCDTTGVSHFPYFDRVTSEYNTVQLWHELCKIHESLSYMKKYSAMCVI